jgi:putative intracellular protease/amidase
MQLCGINHKKTIMKKFKKTFGTISALLVLSVTLFNACKPVREFRSQTVYKGKNDFNWQQPLMDASKKNVFIVADNDGTELFDMMAPFYLFNETGKANVYIIAKNKYPVNVKKGLSLLPQITFAEADSLKMQADVIVIPALIGAMQKNQQDSIVINWIKDHHTNTTKILTVCDGAITAAATGLYDGKFLTTHASDYPIVKVPYTKPIWVQNISVTQSGNLFSTAGVSNATEGSLTVINELFGRETMQSVAANIYYPHADIKTEHQSIAVSGSTRTAILKKVMFKKNKDVGVLLQEGMSEFDLAAVLDTYNRSFPSSCKTYSTTGKTITTKYGLTLIPTGDTQNNNVDELHVLMPETFSKNHQVFFKNAQYIKYDRQQAQYIIDICLKKIAQQYGSSFVNVTKLLLDYN